MAMRRSRRWARARRRRSPRCSPAATTLRANCTPIVVLPCPAGPPRSTSSPERKPPVSVASSTGKPPTTRSRLRATAPQHGGRSRRGSAPRERSGLVSRWAAGVTMGRLYCHAPRRRATLATSAVPQRQCRRTSSRGTRRCPRSRPHDRHRGLDAAEGRSRGGHDALVDADHAELERLDTVSARERSLVKR